MPLKMENRGVAAAVNVAEMMRGSSDRVYKRCMCSVIFMVMIVYVLILELKQARESVHERQEVKQKGT